MTPILLLIQKSITELDIILSHRYKIHKKMELTSCVKVMFDSVIDFCIFKLFHTNTASRQCNYPPDHSYKS